MPAEHYDHLDRLMAVNFYGTVYWAQAAANVSMIPNGRGSIVNVASIAGLVGIPNDIGYVSSKHAVLGLTKALAVEWARYGIRVNAVAPGVTDSPMVQDLADKFPDTMAARISRIPVNRTGRPEEQASGILFLASDDADYITGTTLAIDGGQMALNSGWSPSPQNVSAR
jgi:NAD(P)-dependent dehydrogenase (short-subunit alcohol dehydrogenase family)